ncbi:uncharacterized protein LOC129589395 isoform X3 [Paramacrobiotus metropolitanus]|uniref:uncharacterized protein LOC129589395 isoform X3 n=1 Tax=Paramacrobiotus metropolitanus TaxID=2943436 RepID=UPI00244598A3|nr:uncharacterized protein LOC129589395 isoform X3 [Paramacrobiotus metropolitanus]
MTGRRGRRSNAPGPPATRPARGRPRARANPITRPTASGGSTGAGSTGDLDSQIAMARQHLQSLLAQKDADVIPVLSTSEAPPPQPPQPPPTETTMLLQLMMNQQNQLVQLTQKVNEAQAAPSTSTGASNSKKPPPLPAGFPIVSEKCLEELYDLTVNVDLDKLLRANTIMSPIQGEAKFEIRDGNFILSDSKPKKITITSFTLWNEAFIVFRRVRSYYYPALQQPLDSYHTIMTEMAGVYLPPVWLEYDKTFRACRIRDVTNHDQWNLLDRNLLDRCIARHPLRAHLPLCRDCSIADHTDQDCPKKLQITAQGQKDAKGDRPFRHIPPDLCRNWNNGRCTNGSNCRFKHLCGTCRAADHTVHEHDSAQHKPASSTNAKAGGFQVWLCNRI